MVERKIMKAVFLKYGQTDFAGKEFGYDGEEDGHDEEDVRRADLSRRRKFVGSTADLVHVKADRENQRRQTKQHHADKRNPSCVLRHSSMPMGGDQKATRRRKAEDTQNYENERASPLCWQFRIRADRISLTNFLTHLSESQLHARVFDDDPLGIRQRSDGENVGQEEKAAGNHRQFIHVRLRSVSYCFVFLQISIDAEMQ